MGIGEGWRDAGALIFMFSRSKKERNTSETLNRAERKREKKSEFILAAKDLRDCSSAGLGPGSHDLVPQGLLLQFIFPFL